MGHPGDIVTNERSSLRFVIPQNRLREFAIVNEWNYDGIFITTLDSIFLRLNSSPFEKLPFQLDVYFGD
jgi:hypothetical protein